MNELDVVRDISHRFDTAAIAYMLTGSLAMNYYAIPRMTRDVDVVVALTAADVQRVGPLFHPDYYVSEQSVREAVLNQSIFNLIHQASVIKVDCVVRKRSDYRELEFSRRVHVRIAGFSTWIVSKEDLILSKLEWAKDSRSEIQLDDVKNLIATGYDDAYVRCWAGTLGLTELLEGAVT